MHRLYQKAALKWSARSLAVIPFICCISIETKAQCTAQAGPASYSICAGTQLSLNGSGTGVAPLAFSWTGSPYLSSTNTAQTTFEHPIPVSAATAVDLTLTVTDAAGCVATAFVQIVVQPTPQPLLTTTDPNPDLYVPPGGGAFALCGTGAGNYDFQFTDVSTANPGSSFNVAWGTPPGPYTPPATGWDQSHNYPVGSHTLNYTITDPGPAACSVTATYTVFLGSNPSVGTSNPGNTVLCEGDGLTFPVNNTDGNSPGTEYLVTYGDGVTASFTHPPPASIYYDYPVTNCPGPPFTFRIDALTPCPIISYTTAGPIYVSANAEADFSMTADTACVNSTVTFTGLSTGAMAPACTEPDQIWSITPNTGWTIVSGTLGDMNGSPTPAEWTAGSAVLNINFNTAGTYVIEINSGNGCGTSSMQRSICIEPPPQPAFTLSTALGCAPLLTAIDNLTPSAGCSMDWQWNVNGNTSGCGGVIAWNFATGGDENSFEPSIQFTTSGTYSVQLQATNSCGTFQQTFPVTVNAPPQVEIDPITPICAGDCILPAAVVTSCGSPITEYTWEFPGSDTPTSDDLDPGSICFNTATNSTITLNVENACGSAIDFLNLNVGSVPGPPVVASNSPVCVGQLISLSAVVPPNTTVTWSGPNNFTSNQPAVTIPNASGIHAGTYTVTASSGGCPGASASVQVQVLAAPIVTITPGSSTICAGGNTLLVASGAGNYEWFINSNLIHSGGAFLAAPAMTTTYTVTGSVGGCPGSTTVTVFVDPLPTVNAGVAQVFCDQAIPAQLNGSPIGGTWSGPSITTAGVFTPTPGALGNFPHTYTFTDNNGCTNSATVTTTVQAVTLIADAGNDTTLCQGIQPVIMASSPPGGTWSGAGPGGFTPSIPGAHSLIYTYGTGTCETSDQVEVIVLEAPVLTMPFGIEACADDAPIALLATPSGGTWAGAGISGPPWNFDPGVASAGVHSLSYAYTDANGCTSTESVSVTVHAMPVVDAGVDLQLCDQPIPWDLVASPIGGIWNATWMDVTPDGIITPAGVGVDQLTYTFISSDGCTASDAIIVTIVEIEELANAGDDQEICIGSDPFGLIATPGGGVWSGAGVSPDGIFTPSVAGDHLLTYSVGTSTCLTLDQVVVTVHALPLVDAGTDVGICMDNGLVSLSADPVGGTWAGPAVDPNTGVFDPLAAPDDINILTYTYTELVTGCTNSDDLIVTVHQLPVASFDHAPIACVGASFQFINNSTGASSAIWEFGDAMESDELAPVHTYLSEGEYTIQLVAGTAAGCVDTAYSTVTVWDIPQAALVLDVDSGCGPLAVSFDNNTLGEGVSYLWDLGGLATSDQQDPATFDFPADPYDVIEYEVSLSASNLCGGSEALAPITVFPQPTALFAPDQNTYCSFAEVNFANASYGVPDSYHWDLGDGETSTSPGPLITHVYSAEDEAAEFTISLIATNECGSDTATHTITILPNEVTSFFNSDPVIGCAPLTVQFTQFAVGDTSWHWEFGDTNVSTDHDPIHTFVDAGTYSVQLFNYGCGSDTYSTEITVMPSPIPTFTAPPATLCVGDSITFTNTTSDVANILWDLGDGTSSTLTSVQHTYSSSGGFPVSLTVTSIFNGCTASTTQLVTIDVTPEASFETLPSSGCIDLPVIFENNSTNGDAYQWWFGDGNTSASPSPGHIYTQAGSHLVTLIAENLNGCSDTATAVVIAHPLPISAFTLSQYESCFSPVTIQPTNSSQGAIGYSWDLGNGLFSTLNEPEITFDSPGTYQIILTSSSQFGCMGIDVAEFIVHPTPIAAFNVLPNPACAGEPVLFEDLSLNGSSNEWWFGDGTQAFTGSAMHHFDQPGNYTVTLVTTGAGGCTDTLTIPAAVFVHPTPVAAFIYDTLGSVRNAIRFMNQSAGGSSYTWDFGDSEYSNEIHPIHLFPADGGGSTVCLAVANEFGCTDTICDLIPVRSDANVFVPNAFTPNDDGTNDIFLPILNGFNDWDHELLIFDRWGMIIHRTFDRHTGWDGTRNGQDSPIDVYVWKVILERNGDAREFTGHVSLVR